MPVISGSVVGLNNNNKFEVSGTWGSTGVYRGPHTLLSLYNGIDIKEGSICLYCVPPLVILKAKNEEKLKNKTQVTEKQISQWFTKNKHMINKDKTEKLTFGKEVE